MNNPLSQWHIALMRKQVDEEIQFLIANGHDTARIQVPCKFCIDTHGGHYVCNRINKLKEFKSTLVINKSRKVQPAVQRRTIGFNPDAPPVCNSVHQMPLLSIKL